MPRRDQPDPSDLEGRALAGGAFYVDRIERDPAGGRLTFALVADLEHGAVVRTLSFSGMTDFREEFDEEVDPDLMEQVIGLHREPDGGGWVYCIRLDQSEIWFRSEEEPRLEEIGHHPLAGPEKP